jgi:hypothetical protein
VSYESLNRIRIVDVKVEKDKVTLRGDATGAYIPERRLQNFVRDFVYSANGSFTIVDTVETADPAILTLLLHADDKVERKSDNDFVITSGKIKLEVAPAIEAPAGMNRFQSAIEPNDLTAPGPPGAVDKGQRQIRGQKLLLSTPAPVTRARFTQRLTIQ